MSGVKYYRTTLNVAMKIAAVLVGLHVFICGIFIIVDMTHGINDMDPSFVLALTVYAVNLPTVWLLDIMGIPFGIMPIIIVGILQWYLVSLIMAWIYVVVRKVKNHSQ